MDIFNINIFIKDMSSQHKNSDEIDNRENPVLDDNKLLW